MNQKTPQQLIYEAWKNTKKPLFFERSDAKGNIERKEINFAIPEENEFYNPEYKGICNLCGEPMKEGIPVKKVFSGNYMDWSIHKKAGETHICKYCLFCLGMNIEGRIALFRYPIVAEEEELHLCNRKQFRDFLLNPPEPPFLMILPTSQKKHLFSKSKVSYSKKQYFCNLEEITFSVNDKIRKLVETIEALRGIGCKKEDIAAGSISGNVIKDYEVYSLEKLIAIIEEIRKNPMFPLAIEVAQKAEKEKAICYLDLIPKTN